MPSRYHRLQRQVHRLLEGGDRNDRAGRAVDLALIALICANVAAVVVESLPGLSPREALWLHRFDAFSVAVFTLEYLARLWASAAGGDGPLRARLRHLCRPMAIIDLVAIVPFYLSGWVSADLRLLRVLRLFKLARYFPAMEALVAVLRVEARVFAAALAVLLVVLVLAASGVYVFEHGVQPEAFGSIPAAMWWAVSTLTTVGYGDVTPVTAGGRVFGACITVVGIGIVALPAGILASGFSDQLRSRRAAYSSALRHALADGVVTEAEARSLEARRAALGLSTEQAAALEEALAGATARCPHCGRALGTAPPPAAGEDGHGAVRARA